MYNSVVSINHSCNFREKSKSSNRIEIIGVKPRDPYGWNNDYFVKMPDNSISILKILKQRKQ